MALSNRDRVGRGFELLAKGLEPFVDRRMTAAAPSGTDWVIMISERDRQRHGTSWTNSKSDPQLLLRMLTEEWRVFRNDLSRGQQAWASELREVRNRWAHGDGFNDQDTARALDTMARLLQAVGAVDQADPVQRLLDDHQSAVFEKRSRRAAQDQQATTVTVEGLGLKPWREVIEPHRDIQTGNFSSAEFAADLARVARQEGSDEYVKPVEFFRRTYLTEGLRDLLVRAARRIGGDPNAMPVVNLQTSFGGGKTHSILALYHLFSGEPLGAFPQDLQELLAGVRLPQRVRRATFVGNRVSPSKVHEKPDGTAVRTIWGDLAWQLGGREGYQLVASADETGTNPGEALREVIAAAAPCLILIDEWVAYARQLHADDHLPAGTFATQFTFAQTLTEVVKSVPGALLAVSIPASTDNDQLTSDLEVGGAHGREALNSLKHVVSRVADHWRPASPRESFEIVRRRLFEEPSAEGRAHIAAVARQFQTMYVQHTGEFPRGSGEYDYANRIRECYPIYPELFDRLYEDWSTLERFQRTRGVLRLMSTVIAALWQSGDPAPMILPGTLPLDDDRVVEELTSYLEDRWKTILDTDVDGPRSTPVTIDNAKSLFGKRHMTRRIARTIFFGSAATIRSANKGIDRHRIWLGAAIPGDTVGNFGSALQQLTDTATYLYSEASRYWYDTQASVSRTAKDYAESLRERPEDVWQEIVERLRRKEQARRGQFVAVHVAPDTSGDIPDVDQARLVILHPRYEHRSRATDSTALEFARAALDTYRAGPRTHRNMVVFLAPDGARLEDLTDATRDLLAWRHVCDRAGELDLTQTQNKQAEERRKQADQAVGLRIEAAYVWVLAPTQPEPGKPPAWEPMKADGVAESLAERVSARLLSHGDLAVQHAAPNIRQYLNGPLQTVWQEGHMRVGELWDLYTRYPYLPRLRDRGVLDDGVRSTLDHLGWQQDGFALATGYDEAAGRYQGLAFYLYGTFGAITDSTLLVKPTRAIQQREQEELVPVPGPDAPPGPGPGPVPPPQPPPPPPGPRPSNHFVGVYQVRSPLYARELAKLQEEILPHLTGEGAELTITVEIEARNPGGFNETKTRIVEENARTLKFVQAQFDFDDT
jgi:predicted AAA+ superfamily ATPase